MPVACYRDDWLLRGVCFFVLIKNQCRFSDSESCITEETVNSYAILAELVEV